jgi:DNA-binding LacI/PurR family transcriptional regulator
LLSLGHTRIAAITGPRGWKATEDRRRGYYAALAAAGIMPDPELEVTIRQPLAEMGRIAVSLLLRLLDSQRLEALQVELGTRLVVRDSAAPPRR